MSIYTAIFAPAVAGVLVVLAADLVLGMRELPHAALFRTAEIAILVAYLILAYAVINPPVLMAAWLPLVILLPFAYLALGTAQATAIAIGLEEWGIRSRWRARLGALLLAYLPVVGSAAAAWGAGVGWHWSTGTAVVRFFGPLAAIVAPPLWFFVYVELRQAGILT